MRYKGGQPLKMKCFHCVFGSRGERTALRRTAVLLAILVMVLECLPFALPSSEKFWRGANELRSYVEPLQVCDDGQGFAAFAVDHPWMPGSGVFFVSAVVRFRFSIQEEGSLAPGFPSPVFRPPRQEIPWT